MGAERAVSPRLIVHGGAGALENPERAHEVRSRLEAVAREAYAALAAGSARAAVLCALRLLEDDDLFNAGTGAKLQSDGEARLSCALMDGSLERFSGVVNIQRVRNPSEIAAVLAGQPNRVLAAAGAEEFARRLGVPPHDPVTPHRLAEHQKGRRGRTGTVGAVALDAAGRLCAGTSTGGIGGETPGRVGDSATVAGTYATAAAAVSCTGFGEQIMDQAVAARLVVMVESGVALAEAARSVAAAGSARGRGYGFIALDGGGAMVVAKTSQIGAVHYAAHDGGRVTTFEDAAELGLDVD